MIQHLEVAGWISVTFAGPSLCLCLLGRTSSGFSSRGVSGMDIPCLSPPELLQRSRSRGWHLGQGFGASLRSSPALCSHRPHRALVECWDIPGWESFPNNGEFPGWRFHSHLLARDVWRGHGVAVLEGSKVILSYFYVFFKCFLNKSCIISIIFKRSEYLVAAVSKKMLIGN